jgi:molybdopterin-containing oxidoreductase family iron-sulfur binding subunit
MREVDTKQESLDLAALRARLAGTRGREYWRSLEELAESESFQQLLEREFPEQASEWTDGVSRRRFLNLMAASLALAGLSSCVAPPTEKLVPYVRAPEEIIPGRPLFFATAMPLAASATGVLVESHMGRPIKIEGNPNHPASLGATDTFAQASILSLYDPDRSQVVSNAGRISTWSSFLNVVALEMEREKATGGAGLRLLTESVTSPTLARQIQELLAQFPEARWHQYEPVGRENSRAGARLAFGEDVNAGYNLEAADVILSLDSDFLCTGPGCLRYARQFAKRRRVEGERAEMNRLYVVESTPSNTGMMADHRLPLRASEIEGVARAVAAQLGIGAAGASPVAVPAGWVEAVGRDLQVHRGRSLVVAGESQPPVVHALAHAMNQALGNAGRTVVYTDPVEANPVDQTESLADLSSWAATRSTRRPPTSTSPTIYPRCGCASTSASTRTKPRCNLTGTCRRRTTWRLGATPAPSTAPQPSCNRSSSRSTAASRRWKWCRPWRASRATRATTWFVLTGRVSLPAGISRASGAVRCTTAWCRVQHYPRAAPFSDQTLRPG